MADRETMTAPGPDRHTTEHLGRPGVAPNAAAASSARTNALGADPSDGGDQPGGDHLSQQRRVRNTQRLLVVLAIAAVVTIIFDTILFLRDTSAWQLLAAAGFAGVALILIPVASYLLRRSRLDATGHLILLGVTLVMFGNELVLAGGTPYFAVAGVVIILLTSYLSLPGRTFPWLIASGLYLASVLLINLLEPFARYPIAESAPVSTFVPIILLFIVGAALWLVARAFRIGTIRLRLLISFVAVVLLPTIAVGIGVVIISVQSVQQQLMNQMQSVAILKEAEIRTWLDNLQTDLEVTLAGADVIANLKTVTTAAPTSFEQKEALHWLESHLGRFLERTGRYEELFLLDLQGTVLLSTEPARQGEALGSQIYFREGKEHPYIQRPYYSPTTMRTSIFAAHPIQDEGGQVLGVLAGRASLEKLNEVMAERTGLGETGETYLVDATSTLLTPTRLGDVRVWIGTLGTDTAAGQKANGAGLYENYRREPVVGAYRWLPELQVALLAEQEQSEAFRGTYLALAVIGVVALLAVLLAVGISLLLTRGIADSLARLAEAATQIASGDVTRLADVEQDDEVGTVAQAFNAMTRQLRELIGNLEHRVAERTAALEQRSAYLQASAEVGRTAASILEADRLIQQVVDLIRERFGLYYVGLFAVDEAGEWAVLQAGTGKAGEAMLARGHRLQVGEDSMIGWSIAHAQARVALEAGEDAVRLATPELPETRSEAALPLRVRGQIIGALTVQHTQPGAFNQDAIVALQTMADQVAVALDNARLFTERQEALEAAHRAYGVLSREAWEELLHARPDLGFRCDKLGVVQGAGVRRPETEQALQSGQIVRGDGASTDGRYFLALPIKVRGQTIGVLDTYKSAESGDWTSEEVVLMEAIVGQLDSALESARLFQDTQRRAARERAIRHVTERMRRAVEIEAILKTTVAELAGALGVPRAYVRLGTEAELNPRIGTDSQHLDRAAHTGDGEED